MGKNNKKKQQQKKAAAATATETEEPVEQEQLPMEEDKRTPEERAADYKKQQDEVYNGFLSAFADDQKMVDSEPDFEAKWAEIDKVRGIELKKLDKTLKKELHDNEDIYASCHTEKALAALQDRIARTLTDVCRKAAKKHQQAKLTRKMNESRVSTSQNQIDALKKKTKTLEQFTSMLAQKNFDLYLKHELMLDMEKK